MDTSRTMKGCNGLEPAAIPAEYAMILSMEFHCTEDRAVASRGGLVQVISYIAIYERDARTARDTARSP